MAVPSSAKTYQEIYKGLGSLPFQTDMDAVRARQAQLAGFLGTSDYASRMEEANNLAKFQMALAMAQRGFAGLGATPKRGQSGASALLSNVFAPLAGDISTVAVPLMQQRAAAKTAQEQEERQLKLAALSQVQAEEAERRKLAQSLMPKPVTPKFGLDPYVVVSRDKDGGLSLVKEPGGTAAIQVRQGNVGGRLTITDIKTKLPHVLEPNQEIIKLSVFTKKEGAGKAANVGYMQNKTTEKYEHVTRRGPGEPAYFSKTGLDVLNPEEWTWVGSTIPTAATGDKITGNFVLVDQQEKGVFQPKGGLTQLRQKGAHFFLVGGDGKTPFKIPKGHAAKPLAKYFEKTTGQTAAEATREDRINAVHAQIGDYQASSGAGPGFPISKQAQLIWDPTAFAKGEFPYKIVKDYADRGKDLTITDTKLQKFLDTRARDIIQTDLRGEGDVIPETVPQDRIAAVIRKILNPSLDVILGGAFPEYHVPFTDPDKSPENVRLRNETAMNILRKEPGADPDVVLKPVSYPTNAAAIKRPTGLLKIAADALPGAFGRPSLDIPEDNQLRADAEDSLRTLEFDPRGRPRDHAKMIKQAVVKSQDSRKKWQEKASSIKTQQEVNFRLDFRDAFLNFKNAVREAGNVTGFVSGRVVAGMITIGMEKFVTTPAGAQAWRELQAASERFERGFSRRIGNEFGDRRIAVYDVEDYKKLVASIRKSGPYNKTIIDNGLRFITTDLTNWMALGGRVGYDERTLRRAAKAGVDFSKLSSMENWTGHGYYGQNRYKLSRQEMPQLSDTDRKSIYAEGLLEDSMYRGQYIVPEIDFVSGTAPSFSNETKSAPQNPRMLDTYIGNLAVAKYGPDPTPQQIQEMRRHVINGIIDFSSWRDTLRGQ